MDTSLLAVVGFVLGLIVLDLVALRFGHDSRDGKRELPIGADPVVRLPRLTGRRVPIPRFPVVAKRQLLGHWPLATSSAAAAVQAPSPRPPFRPYVPRDALCYPRFDIAAAGKCGYKVANG